MPHIMVLLILFINLFNLSSIIKCLFLRDTEPLKDLKFGRFAWQMGWWLH